MWEVVLEFVFSIKSTKTVEYFLSILYPEIFCPKVSDGAYQQSFTVVGEAVIAVRLVGTLLLVGFPDASAALLVPAEFIDETL